MSTNFFPFGSIICLSSINPFNDESVSGGALSASSTIKTLFLIFISINLNFTNKNKRNTFHFLQLYHIKKKKINKFTHFVGIKILPDINGESSQIICPDTRLGDEIMEETVVSLCSCIFFFFVLKY